MDPRIEPGFVARLYPLADGFPAPPSDSTQSHSKTKLEFLERFYRTNLALEKLLNARASKDEIGEKEYQECIDHLKGTLDCRDRVEEKYRPRGVWTEPEYGEGFVRNLRFFFPPGSTGKGRYLFTAEIELSQS